MILKRHGDQTQIAPSYYFVFVFMLYSYFKIKGENDIDIITIPIDIGCLTDITKIKLSKL